MTNILTAAKSEHLKSSKPERNNSSGNKSGAATAANFATSSSFTRRATGPRTLQGKERSKFNARKHGLFSKAVLLQDESRAGYGALLNGLMENLQPQGKLEIVLVENLATLLWRKRRLLQVETAETEKAQFVKNAPPEVVERCKWEAKPVTFPTAGKNFDLTQQSKISTIPRLSALWSAMNESEREYVVAAKAAAKQQRIEAETRLKELEAASGTPQPPRLAQRARLGAE